MEISCAHQHLVDQFWSPRTNKRTDEWGGSLENRMRFGIEVFKSIREAVGSDFAVGMRMCGEEFHHDGLSHEDFKEIAQAMCETGLIDFISVVGSGADTHNTLANCMPPMALPPEPLLTWQRASNRYPVCRLCTRRVFVIRCRPSAPCPKAWLILLA